MEKVTVSVRDFFKQQVVSDLASSTKSVYKLPILKPSILELDINSEENKKNFSNILNAITDSIKKYFKDDVGKEIFENISEIQKVNEYILTRVDANLVELKLDVLKESLNKVDNTQEDVYKLVLETTKFINNLIVVGFVVEI
jgi:hypothetical protein